MVVAQQQQQPQHPSPQQQQQQPQREAAKGVGWILFAATVGAPSGLLVRILSDSGSTALAIVFVRNCLYCLVLAAACLATWRCSVGAQLRLLDSATIGASVFLAAQSMAIVAGIALSSVADVTLIINTTPVFCALFDRIFLNERILLRTQLMVASSLMGVGIILLGGQLIEAQQLQHDGTDDRQTTSSSSGMLKKGRADHADSSASSTMMGNLIALGNPISWACYWTILRTRTQKQLKPPDTGIMLLLSGVMGAAASFAAGGGGDILKSIKVSQLGYFALFGCVVLPLAQFGFTMGPRFITSAEISCVKMSEVFLMPLCVFLWNGELPAWTTYLGGSLILIGILGHSVVAVLEERGAHAGVRSYEALARSDSGSLEVDRQTAAAGGGGVESDGFSGVVGGGGGDSAPDSCDMTDIFFAEGEEPLWKGVTATDSGATISLKRSVGDPRGLGSVLQPDEDKESGADDIYILSGTL